MLELIQLFLQVVLVLAPKLGGLDLGSRLCARVSPISNIRNLTRESPKVRTIMKDGGEMGEGCEDLVVSLSPFQSLS